MITHSDHSDDPQKARAFRCGFGLRDMRPQLGESPSLNENRLGNDGKCRHPQKNGMGLAGIPFPMEIFHYAKICQQVFKNDFAWFLNRFLWT